MASVRELIKGYQREIRTTDLLPDRAADILPKLTALMGNCADEYREARMAFNEVQMALLETEKAASRARMRAETTPAFRRMLEARDAQVLCTELVRSLKRYLQTKSDELRLGG
jgi:hypothetical protein